MGNQYNQFIANAEQQYNLPHGLIGSVMRAESGGNPNARSPVGAGGLMQLMPGTARGLGVTNVYNPQQSIQGGAKYLANLYREFGGNLQKTIAAYNAGPGAVISHGGIPPYAETQTYVKRVLGYMGQEHGGGGVVAAPARVPRLGAPVVGGLGAVATARLNTLSHSTIWGGLARQALAQAPVAGAIPVAASVAPTQRHGSGVTGGPLHNYKDILKLGARFGLRIDGVNQTTGGQHAPGSYHYKGEAVDFGNAKNSTAQIDALAAYAHANPGQFKELFFNPLGWGIKNGHIIPGMTVAGHDNHIHVAV